MTPDPAAMEYARKRRQETKRRSKLRALGQLPQLPRCEQCGAKLLVQRSLPLCFDCFMPHQRRSPLRAAAHQVICELRREAQP
jgi:ribosomal protein L32